jgi:hypothetical protein
MQPQVNGEALAAEHPTHCVFEADPIEAARAGYGPMPRGQQGNVTTSQWHDHRPRLHAWALLRHHELTPVVVTARLGQ